MKEIYRIKKGLLKSQVHEIPFDFGLVFSEDGLYKIDIYISETYPLRQYEPSNQINTELDEEDMSLLEEDFSIDALTDENNIIEIDMLHMSQMQRHLFKFSMISHGSLTHRKVRAREQQNSLEDSDDKYIYYAEIEGLKMEFSDITETQKERGGKQIDRMSQYERDHTSAMLIYNGERRIIENHFPLVFTKGENDTIILSFAPANEKIGPSMPYDLFLSIKRDLISLLSFANGAAIRIRTEHVGGYYNIGKIGSETTVSYSGKPLRNKDYSGFFSLSRSRGERIIEKLLFACFDNYVNKNELYDLNTIIFHINGANRADNLHERFFILIICLERLAKKYVDNEQFKNSQIIDNVDYEPIKQELLQVIRSNSSVLGDKLNAFVSKIHELNTVRAKSTEFKFIKLLEHVNIDITPAIQKIISEVRHESIHNGEIGDEHEAAVNYFELDDLMRLIVARLIGYKGRYLPYRGRYTSIGPRKRSS
jgi:hypothetical protein